MLSRSSAKNIGNGFHQIVSILFVLDLILASLGYDHIKLYPSLNKLLNSWKYEFSGIINYMYSDLELREVFHFCFLEQLLKISDPNIYILKGGVNLRFYFKNPRYSEDLDIDVIAGSVDTLKKNSYKIVNDSAFLRKLKTYGIENLVLNDPSKAKQTETTQRFRLRLVNNLGEELPTKIEFSRRAKNISAYTSIVERIDTGIGRKYNRLAYLARHYDASTAIIQKIEALAGRNEVQARDVFDLFILDIGGHTKPAVQVPDTVLTGALEALKSISYKDYESRVLEFLGEDARQSYSGLDLWLEVQQRVEKFILS